MTEYNFWLRADYFTKHLLGNTESSVDMNHINNQIPQSR
jgi:dipeptidyl-peptidase-4